MFIPLGWVHMRRLLYQRRQLGNVFPSHRGKNLFYSLCADTTSGRGVSLGSRRADFFSV